MSEAPLTEEAVEADAKGQQSKYTVMLTPKSVAALREAAELNHETRTKVINRGVQLYRLVTGLFNDGWTLVARDENGREQTINLI